MAFLTFELMLPKGKSATYPDVIVGGGVDVDGDGTIEDPRESLSFKRLDDRYVWTASRGVRCSTIGMRFSVSLTAGEGVDWSLRVSKDGIEIYSDSGTTGSVAELVQDELDK
jgi:hypothetical protein